MICISQHPQEKRKKITDCIYKNNQPQCKAEAPQTALEPGWSLSPQGFTGTQGQLAAQAPPAAHTPQILSAGISHPDKGAELTLWFKPFHPHTSQGANKEIPWHSLSFNALLTISLLPSPKGTQEHSSLVPSTQKHICRNKRETEQGEHNWSCKNHPWQMPALRLNPLGCYVLRKHKSSSTFSPENQLISPKMSRFHLNKTLKAVAREYKKSAERKMP